MHGLHLRFATARSMIDEVRSMTKANEVAGKIAGGSALNEPADVVRRLRGGDVPVYVERVRTPDDSARLVVVERMARVGLTDEQAAECLREAETAATLEHENLVRTCGIVVQRNEISVASDYVDGERLSELWQPATERQATAPLGILVRILLDVLAGLGALHKLRDRDEQHRARIIHGQVTPANVLVGGDGVSRLLRACRVRLPGVVPTRRFDTLAPEVLSGAPAEHRADIFSVGAMLRGSLTGKLPVEGQAKNRGTHLRTPAAVGSEAAWARPLFDIAARATAAVPDKRFPTAAAMATEVRKIAGSHLASTEQVAEFVRTRAGDKIAARRERDPASRTIAYPRPKRAVAGAALTAPAPVAQEVHAVPSKITTLQMPTLHHPAKSNPPSPGSIESTADGADAAPPIRAPSVTESSLVVHTPEPMKPLQPPRSMLAALGVGVALLILIGALLIHKRDNTSDTATSEGSAPPGTSGIPVEDTPPPSPEVTPAPSASAAKARKAK